MSCSFIVPTQNDVYICNRREEDGKKAYHGCFRCCVRTIHAYINGVWMPFNFYLPLIYVVGFFLLQFMQLLLERSCILSSYTMIRTISNCNDCLSHRCHVHKRQCRCRSHRKIKVRTYWHRQSLKRATYSQNNKHKHTHKLTAKERT